MNFKAVQLRATGRSSVHI